MLEELALGQAKVFAATDDPYSHEQNGQPSPERRTLPLPAGAAATSCRLPVVPEAKPFLRRYGFDKATALKDIWITLPPAHIADQLVDWYFSSTDWGWHIVHEHSFREEVAEFHSISQDLEERTRVDPAWLSLCASDLRRG